MAESFSSALRLGGLDDYMNPAQECVLPLLKPHETSEGLVADATNAAPPRVRPIRQSRALKRRAQQRTDTATAAANGTATAAAEPPSRREAAASTTVRAEETSVSSPVHASSFSKEDTKAIPVKEGANRVGKISLSDCLSCSGCLTSAEGILLDQQSASEFFSLLSRKQRPEVCAIGQQKKQYHTQKEKGPKIVAVSLSSQCIAAVSLHFKCSPTTAAGRLSFLFRLLGADFVFSMAAAEALTLLESHKEFAGRLYQHKKERKSAAAEAGDAPETDIGALTASSLERVVDALLPSSGPLPLVTSYCPGLVLYAEKNLEAPLLAFLSRVRSAQQIQGLLCKSAVRGVVEAVSFLLALKAHAWPGNAAVAARVAGEVSAHGRRGTKETNTPWHLLQILLARSPYAFCSGGASGDSATGAAAARPDSDVGEVSSAQSDLPLPGDAVGLSSRDTSPPDAASRRASVRAVEAVAAGATVMAETQGRQRDMLLPEDILHVCVMPCFDKKLEAARPDFMHPEQQEQPHSDEHQCSSSFLDSTLAFGNPRRSWSEVDMVLATSELPLLLRQANTSFDSLPCAPLDSIVPGAALSLVAHSLRRAAATVRRTTAAAKVSHQADVHKAEAAFNSDDAGISSARAAEKAADEADEAAKLLPALPHVQTDESTENKGVLTGISRPTAVLAGSGGFLEFLFLQTARGFFGREILPESLTFDCGPNEELQSLALLPDHCANDAEAAGVGNAVGSSRGRSRGLWRTKTRALLRGAFAYGFRNIQNVAQQLRVLLPTDEVIKQNGPGSGNIDGESGGTSRGIVNNEELESLAPYIFEVGACPGGCLNGGGQAMKTDSVESQIRSHISTVASSRTALHLQGRQSMESSEDRYEPKMIGKFREPLGSLTRLFHKNIPLLPPQAHPIVLPAYAFVFGCCYGEEGGPAAAAALQELEKILHQREAMQDGESCRKGRHRRVCFGSQVCPDRLSPMLNSHSTSAWSVQVKLQASSQASARGYSSVDSLHHYVSRRQAIQISGGVL